MTESTKPISALRQRMIEDMTMRKMSPATQRGYVRPVKRFVHFFGRSPDQAEAEDLRRFQLHLSQSGTSSTHINQIITGLRFLQRHAVPSRDLVQGEPRSRSGETAVDSER